MMSYLRKRGSGKPGEVPWRMRKAKPRDAPGTCRDFWTMRSRIGNMHTLRCTYPDTYTHHYIDFTVSGCINTSTANNKITEERHAQARKRTFKYVERNKKLLPV